MTEIYVPDGVGEAEALGRTTALGVVAHADDLEILAHNAILDCFGRPDRWFCGVVATDGAGSSRTGPYAAVSDADMVAIRRHEQRKAAMIGEYAAVLLLGHTSEEVKSSGRGALADEIADILRRTRPEIVYTHNLADRHDTHVAVALATIAACRALPAGDRPRQLLGGEVWRDLDWLSDDDKVVRDVAPRENLAAALIGVFDSQITGGKRYDLAVLGRRRAHATYHQSHHLDASSALAFFMDLTPLLHDPALDPGDLVRAHVQRFAEEVTTRVATLSGKKPSPL
jgi:LmbE family N-acetylglucosaminyl deacetylase